MITIENGRVLYGDNLDVINTNLLIQDQEIVEVSPNISRGKVIDAKGCIVAPAFINSHVHLGDSVAMDLADGKPIDEIVKPPFGIKHQILANTPTDLILDSMKKSMWEMLSTGTTTFVDYREGGLEGINLLNEASKDIPIRKIALGRHDSFLQFPINPVIEVIIEEILESCDGIALSGLGEINDKVASIIVENCKKMGKLSSIHVAEYEQVQMDSMNFTGMSEVQRALKAGFDLLVHLTAPIGNDLNLVADNGVSVVCCPRSNGALAVGIPPVKEMFDLGVNLLLGTDNVMLNSPNLLREMEYTLKVIRGYYREYFPPKEILKMVTVNASKALNLNVGSLEEDKLADVIIVQQISHDPILSIINRSESKNIKGLITEGELVCIK
jgi:cytosine/adenosine deaminase-related metal-dependent hydrolase